MICWQYDYPRKTMEIQTTANRASSQGTRPTCILWTHKRDVRSTERCHQRSMQTRPQWPYDLHCSNKTQRTTTKRQRRAQAASEQPSARQSTKPTSFFTPAGYKQHILGYQIPLTRYFIHMHLRVLVLAFGFSRNFFVIFKYLTFLHQCCTVIFIFYFFPIFWC